MSDNIWVNKTVTELKVELRDRELPTSGKKEVLVGRLVASDKLNNDNSRNQGTR